MDDMEFESEYNKIKQVGKKRSSSNDNYFSNKCIY